MESIALDINGCFELRASAYFDDRGSFVKTYHGPMFEDIGIDAIWKEEYYSISKENVVRGLHFQRPPFDHHKLVYCSSGRVIDVLVDLRVGSKTFGKHVMLELSQEKSNLVFIPSGIAHGFCTLDEPATMIYKTSSVYSKQADTGIHWNSVDIEWPIKNPIVSSRDQGLQRFDEISSPFKFKS